MKKIYLLFIFSALLMLGSCSDAFFDINDNPNAATEQNMSPDLILPRSIHRIANQTATGNSTYQQWMGYYARCAGQYGPNADTEAFQLSSTTLQGQWNEWYDILKDLDVIEKKAVETEQTGYVAIAKILKTIGFMSLVDQYNNIPYSKTFDLANNMLTPYDDAKAIYDDMIKQLAEADELLKNANVSANYQVQRADVVFQGDFEKWRKLGNTQRLRLLIHESDVLGDAEFKAEVAKITANGGGFLTEGETAQSNISYSADVNKQNPFWNTYNVNDQGADDNFYRANNFFLDLLRGNGDIRYTRFYQKAKTPIDGEYYIGFDFGQPGNDHPDATHSSKVSGPGIARSVSMPQWFLPSFESLFLQAEAIQRGALTGDAKAMYERAVKESFAWLGDDSFDAKKEAENYLNSETNNFPKWDVATDKLKLIYTQKYIAMYGINGLESWTDYRRTGVPTIPPSLHPSVGSNRIPTRLIYPSSEYQYNKENVNAQGEINPQTNKIFWDKN